MMLKLLLLLGIAIVVCPHLAAAQASNVRSTTNLSSTLSGTNTFQSIQVKSNRNGCLVQNNTTGTNNQWVYFGPIVDATEAKAILLEPGQGTTCNLPNGVLNDQISIAGTSGDTYYAGVQ